MDVVLAVLRLTHGCSQLLVSGCYIPRQASLSQFTHLLYRAGTKQPVVWEQEQAAELLAN